MKILRTVLAFSIVGVAVPRAHAAELPSSKFAPSKKSYALGSTLSVLPGLLVHGTGHHYAGAHGQALVLHALEGTAIGLIAAGFSRGYDEAKGFSDDLPGDISGITRWEGMIVGGVVLFLSSWLYDVFGTPKAVSAWNAGVDREAAMASTGGAESGGTVAAGGKE